MNISQNNIGANKLVIAFSNHEYSWIETDFLLIVGQFPPCFHWFDAVIHIGNWSYEWFIQYNLLSCNCWASGRCGPAVVITGIIPWHCSNKRCEWQLKPLCTENSFCKCFQKTFLISHRKKQNLFSFVGSKEYIMFGEYLKGLFSYKEGKNHSIFLA